MNDGQYPAKGRFIGRTTSVQNAPIQHLMMHCNVPKDAISFGQGVPFFGPPKEAVAAAATVLSEEVGYRYGLDIGTVGLRNVIAGKLKVSNGIDADPDENIIVCAGANQAFFNVISAITDPADGIVLPTPYYFNHEMAVRIAGCRPILVPTDEDYQLDVDAMFDAVDERTRAVVTVSPNNPTGAVFPSWALNEVNERCADAGIIHISDEAYEHFAFGMADHYSPGSFDKTTEHTISLFSFSKSFGMPGYRVGYSVHPEWMHNDVLKVQDTIGLCAPMPSQAAAEAALRLCPDYPSRFVPTIEEVRSLFIKVLTENDIPFPVTDGGFYFLLKLPDDVDALAVAKRLIEDHGIITIPGRPFGATFPALRVSYGNIDLEVAAEGLERLVNGLEAIL